MIADPPYEETGFRWDKRADGWLDAASRSSRLLWCFGSFRFFLECAAEFAFASWRFSQDVIWEKQNGSGPGYGDRFYRIHELVGCWYQGAWTAAYHETPRLPRLGHEIKGGPRTNGVAHRGKHETRPPYIDDGFRLATSVLRCRNEKGFAEHPTQKPLGLLELLVRYSAPEGGFVCDPFMGSGTTLLAAKKHRRSAIGIEIEEKYCAIAAKRLEQARYGCKR